MSFVEALRKTKANAPASGIDPWLPRLRRVRGNIGGDGIERISTQSLFDFLGVSQRSRATGACRRMAMRMRELGWTPTKARGLTQSGFREQIRGYARDTRGSISF
jgi:hypothetical protein